MPLPLLALLAAAPQVIGTAIDIYNAVRGEKSSLPASATPAQVDEAVRALPPEQAASVVEQIRARVEQYRAETDRMESEQGRVDAATLAAIDPETRGRVAWLRMTTRPRIVLRLSHVMLLPVYIIAANTIISWLNAALGRGIPLVGAGLRPDDLFWTAYQEAAKYSTYVVVGYMVLRQIGKARDEKEDAGLAQVVSGLGGLASKIRGIFGKG